MKRTVSILICTQNRASNLKLTLESLAVTCVPEHLKAELILVDNASTDHTRKVMESCRIPEMELHILNEPHRGKARSLNRAIGAASGDVLLFTDDDVLVPCDWIEKMSRPIFQGEAHAVAGAIRIPPHLNLPWMDDYHRGWLGSTEGFSDAEIHNMIGCNMACSREVFEKVPKFDVELGPGMLGYHEESLFTWQLKLAGFRIKYLPNVVVEHHFPKSRLTRESMLSLAERAGRSSAYVAHHWEHRRIEHAFALLTRAKLRLAYWRLRRFGLFRPSDRCPRWEMEMVMDAAYYEQYQNERSRSRNYRPYALKRSSHKREGA